MKTERRHELHGNALAQELTKLQEFLRRYGNWLMIGVTIVLLALMVFWWSRAKTNARLSEQQATFDRLVHEYYTAKGGPAPAELIQLAQNAKDPNLAIQTLFFLGDEVYGRQYILDAQQGSSQAEADLADARKYYNMVIQRYSEHKPMVAKAYLGLGILDETHGDFAAARKEYQEADKLVAESFPVAQEIKLRLRNLDYWATTAPIASTAPASAPASAPAATPVTRPAARPAAAPAGAR